MKIFPFLLLYIPLQLFAHIIPVHKVESDLTHISYSSSLWKDINFTTIILHPQTSVLLSDAKANAFSLQAKIKYAKIKALYNTQSIAFLLTWKDSTINVQQGKESDTYADGFSIEFAPNSTTLPNVLYGSAEHDVVIHTQKAARHIFQANGNGNIFYQLNPNQVNLFGAQLEKFQHHVTSMATNDDETLSIAHGYMHIRKIKQSPLSNARLGYKDGAWFGSLTRPFHADALDINDTNNTSIALFIYDGAELNRGVNLYLTPWISLQFDTQNNDSH